MLSKASTLSHFRCQHEAWADLPSVWFKVIAWDQWSPSSHKSSRDSSESPVSPWDSVVSLPSESSASYIATFQFYGGRLRVCVLISLFLRFMLHCRRCLSPWLMLPRIFAPTWWKKPTFDKTWFMPALKRFPSHVPLLKMSCWSSLELISLTKLGRFVMFINRGAAVSVNAFEAAVKGVVVGFIHTECM